MAQINPDTYKVWLYWELSDRLKKLPRRYDKLPKSRIVLDNRVEKLKDLYVGQLCTEAEQA